MNNKIQTSFKEKLKDTNSTIACSIVRVLYYLHNKHQITTNDKKLIKLLNETLFLVLCN